MSEARSWSNIPSCAADGGQDMVAACSPEEGEIDSCGEALTSSWLISCQGNQQKGTPFTVPLIRTITSWGLQEVCRKVSLVSRL